MLSRGQFEKIADKYLPMKSIQNTLVTQQRLGTRKYLSIASHNVICGTA